MNYVQKRSFWYHFRKRFPLYVWPVLATTVIFIDWNHTRQWKASNKYSVLDVELLGKAPPMGTFTVSYFAKKAFWDKRNYWLISAAAYYFGRCWDNAGYAKAEMMKGHSRMFADRHQQITQNSHADPWKY